MLRQFDRVLTAMAYAAAGLCVFAIAWAGFVLMAEGADEPGRRQGEERGGPGGGGAGPGAFGQGRGRAAAQRHR